MKDGDIDGDGKISYKEFLYVFRKHEGEVIDEIEAAGNSIHDSDHGLLGLQSPIPGGQFDKDLSPSDQATLEKEKKRWGRRDKTRII